jgi:phosphopentomutase
MEITKKELHDALARIEQLEIRAQKLEDHQINQKLLTNQFKADVYKRTKEKIENPNAVDQLIQSKILQLRSENKGAIEIAKLLSEPLSKIERLTAYMSLRGEYIHNYKRHKRESYDTQIEIADLIESYLDENIPVYKIGKLLDISSSKIETIIYKHLIHK